MPFLIIGGGSGIGKTTMGRQLETLLLQKYGPTFGLTLPASTTTHPSVFCVHIFIRVGSMSFDPYPLGFSASLKVWRERVVGYVVLILFIVARTEQHSSK